MKKRPDNEEQLLQLASQESGEAFRQLVIFYHPDLLTFVTQITQSREKAEEVVQDVFMQVWSVRETLSDIKNFRGFLFVISKNLALNAMRAGIREKLRQRKWVVTNNDSLTVEPEYFSADPNPLDVAIEQLPPQQRRVWIATRKEGKKLNVVAQEMNISLATVKKYVKYANQSITSFLIKKGDLLLVIALFWKK